MSAIRLHFLPLHWCLFGFQLQIALLVRNQLVKGARADHARIKRQSIKYNFFLVYRHFLTGPSSSEGDGTAWAPALPEGQAGLPATHCPFASPRKGSVCFQCLGWKPKCRFLHCQSCFCIKTQAEGIKYLLLSF